MKAQKTILFILILIAGVAAFLYSNKEKPATKSIPALVFRDAKITDNTKPFIIDVTYPTVLGQDVFNAKVKSVVDKELADFKKNSLENDAAVKKIDPKSYSEFPREYNLTIKNYKGLASENIISAVLEIYSFVGGAHGETYFKAINFNPKTGKDIKFSDLIGNNQDSLKQLSDFCIADLTKQMKEYADSRWISEGAGPKEENYKNFLSNYDLTIYFDQYQVAPGAGGTFKCVIPHVDATK